MSFDTSPFSQQAEAQSIDRYRNRKHVIWVVDVRVGHRAVDPQGVFACMQGMNGRRVAA